MNCFKKRIYVKIEGIGRYIVQIKYSVINFTWLIFEKFLSNQNFHIPPTWASARQSTLHSSYKTGVKVL